MSYPKRSHRTCSSFNGLPSTLHHSVASSPGLAITFSDTDLIVVPSSHVREKGREREKISHRNKAESKIEIKSNQFSIQPQWRKLNTEDDNWDRKQRKKRLHSTMTVIFIVADPCELTALHVYMPASFLVNLVIFKTAPSETIRSMPAFPLLLIGAPSFVQV